MKEFDSKLIPILREGIETIKMVIFKEIQILVSKSCPDEEKRIRNMLSGSVLNEIFSQQNTNEPYATFNKENRERIQNVITCLISEGDRMLIPITDTIRMEAICEKIETGGDCNDNTLHEADRKGLLLKYRDLPMPHTFLDMARRLGSATGIITPPQQSKSIN